MAGSTISVHVQYFAVLREQRGCSAETLTTAAKTPRELFAELSERHGFSLDPTMVRASVNLEFVPMDRALRNGDAIVFIPPVAGG
jgi:molybdopterin converting factor small subunit